jgi:SAM-dependent methyltransferase
VSIEARYYGDEADRYDELRQHTRTRRDEDAAFERLYATADAMAPIRSVLDVPCGTGRWIAFLHSRDIDYSGVDISRDMLKHAGRRLQDHPPRTSRLIEESCFDYLPRHPASADLVISTRFINWWDLETAQRLLDMLCAASRRHVILHIRVDENAAQGFISRALRYPGEIRKTLKSPNGFRGLGKRAWPSRFGGAIGRPRITYHRRAAMLERLEANGCRLAERTVLRRHLYGRIEFWLISKPSA